MKKFIVFFAMLLISISVFSQFNYNERRNIEDFSEVRISGNVKAVLIKSDSNYVKLSSNSIDLADVTTAVEKKVLKVSNISITEDEDIFINIYYKDIDYIIGDVGANISLDDTLMSDKIELLIKNGTIFRGKVSTKKLILTNGTETTVFLSGYSDYADIECRAGGVLEAKDFIVDEMDITATIGAKAKVKAVKKLNASASIDAIITYFGEPEKISQKANLRGKVKKAAN